MKWGKLTQDLVVVRGGGDLATGVIQKLYRAGIRVVVLETSEPMAVRRTVSLCTAVPLGIAQVEDMTARRVETSGECAPVWAAGEIPILVDPQAKSLRELVPTGVVDAILAKKNIGTHRNMAPVVIALGPGFTAGKDAHAVVETMRGHTLGKVLFNGEAIANTGIPGVVGGKGAHRVLRAPCDGCVQHLKKIGDVVQEGEGIFSVEGVVVTSPFTGLLRGLIQEGILVAEGTKTADVDPRLDSDCLTISDKARCIGGGVLEAYLYFRHRLTNP